MKILRKTIVLALAKTFWIWNRIRIRIRINMKRGIWIRIKMFWIRPTGCFKTMIVFRYTTLLFRLPSAGPDPELQDHHQPLPAHRGRLEGPGGHHGDQRPGQNSTGSSRQKPSV